MRGRVRARIALGCMFAILLVALFISSPFAGRAVPGGGLSHGPGVQQVGQDAKGMGEGQVPERGGPAGQSTDAGNEQAEAVVPDAGGDAPLPGVDVDALAAAIAAAAEAERVGSGVELGGELEDARADDAEGVTGTTGTAADPVQLPNPERERFTDVVIGPQPTWETSHVISEIPLWSDGATLRASFDLVDIDRLRESVVRYSRDGDARKAAVELSGELALGTSGSLRVGYEVIEEFTELGSFRTNITDAGLSYQIGERTRIEAGVGRGVTPEGVEQSAGLDLAYRIAPNTSFMAGIKMLSFGDAQNAADFRESLAEASLQLRF